MLVFDSPAAMRAWSDEQRSTGHRVGLVPTMGALHRGHVALIHEAQRRSDVVVMSIFVNPLQFNRPDDFEGYPRPMSDDIECCRTERVDAVYAPTPNAMYPAGFDTHVLPGKVADGLEGAGRPGHFRGVATVVTKLFNAVDPHVAVFGEKDYQQLSVIRHMVHDLDMGIDIVGVATEREPDGLALSSRNRRLSAPQRAAAVVVPTALSAMRHAYAERGLESAALCAVASDIVAQQPLASLEYVEIIDGETLQPASATVPSARVVVAVWFGEVRLIDNIALSGA